MQATIGLLHGLHGVIFEARTGPPTQGVKPALDLSVVVAVDVAGGRVLTQTRQRDFLNLLKQHRADFLHGVAEFIQPQGLCRGLLPEVGPQSANRARHHHQPDKGQFVNQQNAA